MLILSSLGVCPASESPYQRVLADGDRRKIEALDREMAGLQDANQFAAAAIKAEEIRALRAEALGADHYQSVDARWHRVALELLARSSPDPRAKLKSVQTLLARAEQHERKGAWTAAEPILREALDCRLQIFGEGHPEFARGLALLASNLRKQGKPDPAEQLYRRASEIFRRLLGDGHPEYAASISNIASLLADQNRFGEAEPLYHQALAILENQLGPESGRVLTLRNNLALHLSRCGQLDRAESQLRQVLSASRRVFGEDHTETARAYNNLAFNLHSRGRFTEAEPLFRRAAVVCREQFGADHPHTASAYSNLAISLGAQGRQAESEPLLNRAVEIWQARVGEAHPLTLAGMNNLATCLDDQGYYSRGERLLRRALDVGKKASTEDQETRAALLHNLASCLGAQQRYEEAVPLIREALRIREGLLGKDHLRTSDTRSNLAFHLTQLGEHAEADELNRRVLADRRRTLGESHPLTADSYNNIASPLQRQGRYTDSEPLLRRALAIRLTALGETHPLVIQSLNNLAANLSDQGRYAEAEQDLLRAAKGFEAARLRATSAGLGRATFSADQSPFLHLAVLAARDGRFAEAWRRLEANLARGLLDDLAAREFRTLRAEESQRERDLLARVADLDARLVAPATGARERREIVDRRKEALDRLGEHAAAIAAREVYDLDRIRKHLPADAALIAWIDLAAGVKAADPSGDHWACLVRRTGEPVWVRLTGTGPNKSWTNDDERLAEQLRDELRTGTTGNDSSWKALAQSLQRQCLGPVLPYLSTRSGEPSVRHLLVLPTTRLAGIPLEVLADDRVISYAPSGTMLARLCEKRPVGTPGPKALLVLADPKFEQIAGRQEYPRLPGTRREAESIGRLFQEKAVLLDSDATEARLAEMATGGELARFGYLHIATHGEVNEHIALESALILSRTRGANSLDSALAERSRHDGRLTAGEVLRNWRLNASLVTLSTCQSGLGRFQGGEGHVGFSQAFLLAGAQSLVLSMWQVDDTATALLMQRLYQNILGKRDGLAKPMSKAAALLEARQWLRNLSDKDVEFEERQLPRGTPRTRRPAFSGANRPYAHPHYWAAFILVGDPD